MRIVVPPSETKKAGGHLPPLDLQALAFPEVTSLRTELIEELSGLSADTPAAMSALALGKTGEKLLEFNRTLTTQQTLPAIARYTGVVYDALDYEALVPPDRQHANDVVWVFSALFGLIRATDTIPSYRLSALSKLPGGKLAKRWSKHAETFWAEDFTIDLRSEAYRALAPLTPGSGVFVRVVTDSTGGRVAVGHANKATKGELVRLMVTSGVELRSVDELIGWGSENAYLFERAGDGTDDVLLVLR